MRRKKPHYHCSALEALARQLLFAPLNKRISQIRQTERLYDQIDVEQNYPFDFIHYRVTGYHSEIEREASTILVGQAILPDLQQIIEQLTWSITMPAIANDPVRLISDLASELGVSTRTLTRWRKKGLRVRWTRNKNHKHQVLGITASAVASFQKRYPGLLSHAEQFSRMSHETKKHLLSRAHRLGRYYDLSLNKVAVHLAKRSGYGTQTIRDLLIKFDQHNPSQSVFQNSYGSLTPLQKKQIIHQARHQIPRRQIIKNFRRTRSTIQRVLLQHELQKLKRIPLTWIHIPTFERPDADQVLLATSLIATVPPTSFSDDQAKWPPALMTLYRQPQFTTTIQRRAFVLYNYLKYKAATLRQTINQHDPALGAIEQCKQAIRFAGQLRDQLIASNLPEVLLVAKQYMVGKLDPSLSRLLFLLQVGNTVLFDTLETFEPPRSQLFSSLLHWHLQRQFAKQTAELDRAQKRLDMSQVLVQMRATAASRNIRLPQ